MVSSVDKDLIRFFFFKVTPLHIKCFVPLPFQDAVEPIMVGSLGIAMLVGMYFHLSALDDLEDEILGTGNNGRKTSKTTTTTTYYYDTVGAEEQN